VKVGRPRLLQSGDLTLHPVHLLTHGAHVQLLTTRILLQRLDRSLQLREVPRLLLTL
jgi:hypothetical protein